MESRSLEKTFLWIVKIGLLAIPFLPLYVSSSMLFPFITGKNFTFRIIVEILFVIWAGLAWARSAYRPRLSAIFKAVSIFIGVLFVADLLSPNSYRSFFSNYERMEGFMMLVHLYLYFVMLVSIFKTRRDWFPFFQSTIIASVIISGIGLWQKLGYAISIQGGFRVDSTIGNPTYLAAYLLFHIWLLTLCIYEYRRRWLRVIYACALLFELLILYFTATRGVVIAFAIVLPLLLAFLVWKWQRFFQPLAVSHDSRSRDSRSTLPRGEKASGGRGGWGRRIAAVVLIASIIIPICLWLGRGTPFVTKSPVLHRLTNLSLDQRTIRSRFQIWGMSLQAVRERPILGWGQENYYLVFQKYFNSGLFDQEPWFDRSHNIIFDWLVHAGIVGLVAYLGIFAAVFASIIRATRKTTFPLWNGLILIGLFTTYCIQNLFVFDNLNTYLLFFAFLAYTHILTYSGNSDTDVAKESQGSRVTREQLSREKSFRVLPTVILGVVLLVGGYYLHIRPIAESQSLISALQLYQVRGAATLIEQAFHDALAYHSFGDTEVREQLVNIARSFEMSDRFSPQEKKQFLAFAINEMRKETTRRAPDVKHVLLLGSLLNEAIAIDPSYAKEAGDVLQRAVRLSPQKQISYFELAQWYLNIGDVNHAAEAVHTAWLLDKKYKEAAANVLVVSLLAKRADIVAEVTPYVPLNELDEDILFRIALAYQRVEDFASARDVFRHLVARAPKNPRYHAGLAALLAHFGDSAGARHEAEEAGRLDPSFKKESDLFIKSLPAR